MVDPVALAEQHAARVKRRLGELDLADVVLGDRQQRLAVGEDVGEGPAVGDDPRRARSERPVDRAVGREHAREVELGDHLDDPGAADTGHVRAGERRIVRPDLAPDHAEARLERLGVDPHPLDRARRGALPAADLRALECRPVGLDAARSRSRLPSTISAFVPMSTIRLTSSPRYGASERITPAASAPTWPAMQGSTYARAPGFAGMPRSRGRTPHRLVDRERERRPAELRRVEAEQEVVHDRVADERDLEDVVARDAGILRQLGRQLREAAAHGAGQLLLGAGVHHHVRDAAHQILAEPDLRVHLAGRGEHLAGGEVAEVPGDRGRADVEGDAVRGVVEARARPRSGRCRHAPRR